MVILRTRKRRGKKLQNWGQTSYVEDPFGVDGREAREGRLQRVHRRPVAAAAAASAAATRARVVDRQAPGQGEAGPASPVTLWNNHL